MNKLKLRLDDLRVDTFHITQVRKEKGTVFGEQCTCPTACTCPGCPTCDASCNGTCVASCNGTCDASCDGTCANCPGGFSTLSCAKPWLCADNSLDYCDSLAYC